MPLNPDAVGSQGEPADVSWTSKDALLYAVGIGAGQDELAFTTENTNGVEQLVFPTFPVVIGWGKGSPLGKIGTFNPALLVHGQQAVTLHRPIPVEGTATIVGRVAAMYDKEKAAVVVTEAEATMDGEPLYTNRSSMFIRGEGGWGGERGPSGPQNVPPDRAPDHEVSYQTSPDQAFVYRLSGDRNPLHTDPSFAAMGGFDRPDPARVVQLRLHGARPVALPVRIGPGALPPHRGSLRVARHARRRADDPGVGDRRRRRRLHDVGRRPRRHRPGPAALQLSHPSVGRTPVRSVNTPTASNTRMSSRSPVRRSLTSMVGSSAAMPRPTTTIVGMPSSSASLNLTPGDTPSRSSSSTRRPAASRSAASCSPAGHCSAPGLPAITTCTSAGATSRGQHRPSSSDVVSAIAATARDTPMP